jgi:predicted ester cyclase
MVLESQLLKRIEWVGLVLTDVVYRQNHRPGIHSGFNTDKQFLASMITAFPDFQTTIDHILADDDRVVVFTTTNGTHQGPLILAPVPPTGIENRKIIEHWDVIESLDMLREIGAITFNQQQ